LYSIPEKPLDWSKVVYIVTTKQMQQTEQVADANGLPYAQMMENAGQTVAKAISLRYEVAAVRVLILIGPGNNGGDGLVVARHLVQFGAVVTVYIWKRNLVDDENWLKLEDVTGVDRIFWDDDPGQVQLRQLLADSRIIIDALLGTGVSRPIAGTLATLLDLAKAMIMARRIPQPSAIIEPARSTYNPDAGDRPVVVAVDVPSGLNSDTGAVDPHTLAADLTVTLAAVKRGHILLPGPEVVGELLVGDIGITVDCYPDERLPELAAGTDIAPLLPGRPSTAHKGTFGTALLVAGCINYVGAAILAGQAATRIGAGLVTMAIPHSIYNIVTGRLAEATYLPLPDVKGFVGTESVSTLVDNLERATAMLIGPGLGNSDSPRQFLADLLRRKLALPPLIIDADALNILAGFSNWWTLIPSDSVLTPHPGEMARLMATTTQEVQQNRLQIASEAATKWEQVVLLKGAYTIVAAPHGRVTVLPFANPALAKAGSGDVLAGTIVGLLAQGLPPFEAAVAGAYLHGLAGELAREQLGAVSVVAGDLVGFLPVAVQEITNPQ
jgi:hydroxyethylthiazole kinase-like uncharacterized protein yjeF